MSRALQTTLDPRRAAWVTPEALNVAPDLINAPLAKPVKRALAIGLDFMVIGLLSGSGNFWMVLAVSAMFLRMRAKQQKTTASQRQWVVWVLCAICLWMLLQLGAQRWRAWNTADTPATAKVSTPSTTAPVANASAPAVNPTPPAAGASQGTVASTPPPEPEVRNSGEDEPAASEADRIAQLEAQLAEARKPQVFRWRTALSEWSESLGLGFGWAIIYFTLLPVWLEGQTLGKKVFGLRVMELTGKRLTPLMCFGRYGGYAAGAATGMVGFAQILWDANRQAVQDKIAHTVVIDLRAPKRELLYAQKETPLAADDLTTSAAASPPASLEGKA